MARQNFVGLVVSQGKMQKTVKVRVQNKIYDKRIDKEVLKRKDYLVHDEGNLCKEGDIVRIEAIPKITPRKYFAIAEIKVNRGQQFQLYEELAKQKVQAEEKALVNEFIDRRQNLELIITKIEDLKLLDKATNKYQADPETNRQELVDQINQVKQKYNLKSWPTDEPILPLKISQEKIDLAEFETRRIHIDEILNKLMSDEFTKKRNEILKSISKKDIEDLKPGIQKNILRKYVLDERNECPVTI